MQGRFGWTGRLYPRRSTRPGGGLTPRRAHRRRRVSGVLGRGRGVAGWRLRSGFKLPIRSTAGCSGRAVSAIERRSLKDFGDVPPLSARNTASPSRYAQWAAGLDPSSSLANRLPLTGAPMNREFESWSAALKAAGVSIRRVSLPASFCAGHFT